MTTDPQPDRPVDDMRELYAVQHAITDAGGTLTPAVHQAIDALRETWDRELRRAQAEAHQYRTALQGVARAAVPVPPPAPTDRAAEAEPVCKFDEGCHRVVACDPGCGAPAVLPARPAILREAADRFEERAATLTGGNDDLAAFVAKARMRDAAVWKAAAALLRRMADCHACDAGIAHTVHCPTPETHNWGCGCPTDPVPADGPRRMAVEAPAPNRAGGETPSSTAPLAAGLPLVQGNCPACRRASLFLGSGGYVTCSNADCPEPDAATTVLERRVAGEAHQPETRKACGCGQDGCEYCDVDEADEEQRSEATTVDPAMCPRCKGDNTVHCPGTPQPGTEA